MRKSKQKFYHKHDVYETMCYVTEMDGIKFVCEYELNIKEIAQYVRRAKNMYGKYLEAIYAYPDGEDIDLTYKLSPNTPHFDRIRRITGYLVGTLDRFNDGKRAEEADRVKHKI